MAGKSRIAKIATRGCGRGYGTKPIKGKVKQEAKKIEKWMKTNKA